MFSDSVIFPVTCTAPEVFPFPAKVKVIEVQKDEGYKETNHVYTDWA